MENKKGSGIFLGVVSIATLVVAIIGATFAYFSASAESGQDAVGAQAYEFNVAVTSVEKIQPTTGTAGLIPLDSDGVVENTSDTNLLYALNKAENICVDSNNYQVCQLYKATITNNGTQPVNLSLEVKTISNTASSVSGRTKFEDLTIQSLTYAESVYGLHGTAKTLAPTNGNSVSVDGVTITANAGINEHYFVVYLEEPTVGEDTAADQKDQSAQMGASYTGQLVYVSAGGGNRLTGTFTVAPSQEG